MDTVEEARIAEALNHALLEDLSAVKPHVAGYQQQLILDSTGDEAVRVIVIIDDFAPEDEWTPENLALIQARVRQAVAAASPSRWPYVQFRTEQEQRQIETTAVDELDR